MSYRTTIKPKVKTTDLSQTKDLRMSYGLVSFDADALNFILFPNSSFIKWGKGIDSISGKHYFGLGFLLLVTWI